MMKSNIRRIRTDLAAALARRDLIIHDAGFKDYKSFMKAAVPRRAEGGIQEWLRAALRSLSSVRPSSSSREPVEPARYISPVTMDLIQMRQLEVDALEHRVESLEVEVQKKFSIPTACLVFVLVGAPLGIRARKSGIGVAFLSILFFVFYYLFLAGGEELADRGILSPWFAMWGANIIIGLIGVYLTLEAAEIIRRPRRRPRPRRVTAE
jgi:Lipopolysaccharide export system permease LptF/LptG